MVTLNHVSEVLVEEWPFPLWQEDDVELGMCVFTFGWDESFFSADKKKSVLLYNVGVSLKELPIYLSYSYSKTPRGLAKVHIINMQHKAKTLNQKFVILRTRVRIFIGDGFSTTFYWWNVLHCEDYDVTTQWQNWVIKCIFVIFHDLTIHRGFELVRVSGVLTHDL